MERRTVNFDDLNSKKDLNIIFTKLTLGDATPKIMTVDVPYSDGEMDLTDYFGRVKYNNRQISIEFNIPLFENHMDIYHKVQKCLNGRTRKITLSKDRPWYYYGRLTVGQLSCDDGVWNFEITADCQPYQYQDETEYLEMKASDYVEDKTPYLIRIAGNKNRCLTTVVGGSVGWNQLAQFSDGTTTSAQVTFVASDGVITCNGTASGNALIGSDTNPIFTTNHVYFIKGCPADGSGSTYYLDTGASLGRDYGSGLIGKYTDTTGDKYLRFYIKSGVVVTNLKVVPQMYDLTAMFGSTIADYVYSLETATAGTGVTWLRTYFPKMFGQYNAYDAGSIKSVEGVSAHKMVGKNLYDDSTLIHGYFPATNTNITSDEAYRVVSLNLKAGTYILSLDWSQTAYIIRKYQDGVITSIALNTNTYTFTTTTDGQFMLSFRRSDSATITETIKVQVESGSTATAYEPYETLSYPLDSSLTLRGIPKLNNGSLYFDGDIYASSGTVTRKYGIVDLGTLAWTYSNNYFRTTYFNSRIKKPSSTTVKVNAICEQYATKTWQEITTEGFAVNTTGEMIIADSRYTDATVFKTAMDGVYLVYELATPTTETATSFISPQTVGTTEEYVTESIVPVGQDSYYFNAIVDNIHYEEERPDNPVVKTTIPVKIEKESTTVLVSPGEHIIPQFQITQGDNELVVTPLAADPGTIEIKFKKGRL